MKKLLNCPPGDIYISCKELEPTLITNIQLEKASYRTTLERVLSDKNFILCNFIKDELKSNDSNR